MTRFQILGAVALLSALSAAPALAEHMIDEPGMYAFYHPNGNPNAGTAPADAMALAPPRGNGVMTMKMRSYRVRVRR